MIINKYDKPLNDCSGISVGACASSSSASVSSGNEFYVAQTVFFPCPTNADTVSHPVSA